MAPRQGSRRVWLTVTMDGALLLVVVLDAGAALFWARVGGSLGAMLAVVAAGIALLAIALLAVDVRRQLALRWWERAAAEDLERG